MSSQPRECDEIFENLTAAMNLKCCSFQPATSIHPPNPDDQCPVQIYNSCNQCLIARVDWSGIPLPGGQLGLHDYRVDGHSSTGVIFRQSSNGTIVDELPCPTASSRKPADL